MDDLKMAAVTHSPQMTPIEAMAVIGSKVAAFQSRTMSLSPASDSDSVLAALDDIQSTILLLTNLNNPNQTTNDHSLQKYVAEHAAPRYSGLEQQTFIDEETQRIVG